MLVKELNNLPAVPVVEPKVPGFLVVGLIQPVEKMKKMSIPKVPWMKLPDVVRQMKK